MDKNQVNYTINTMISTLGIPSDIPIYYGYGEKENGIHILCHSEIERVGENFGRKKIQNPPDFQILDDGTLVLYDHLYLNFGEPMIRYKNREVAVAYDRDKNRIIIGFDLIASAFYFLTLVEEKTFDKRDKHNRYCARDGQLSSRFPGQPVVNEMQQVLFKSVLHLYENMDIPVIQKWYWPADRNFAVCLTHDIDFIKPGFLYHLFLPLQRLMNFDHKRTISALKRCIYPLSGRSINPWDYKNILELERTFGVKSTFFIVAGGQGKHDYPYDLNKEKNKLMQLKDSGFEIGLHGSYTSFENADVLEDEKRTLEGIVGKLSGIRQHYLRFDFDTIKRQEKAGFGYDSTLYYADALGFRGGYAHPFFPYNRFTGQMMDIIEISPTVMDKTLLDYKKIDAEKAFNDIEKIIMTVSKHNGLLTLLWHNEMFDDVGFPGWGALYERILTNLIQRKAWIVKADDIWTWWTKRQNIIFEKTEKNDKNITWNYKVSTDAKSVSFRIHNIGDKECMVNYEGDVESRLQDDIFHITIKKLGRGTKLQFKIQR